MRETPIPDRAAIIETMFAQICKSSPEEARKLSLLLTGPERADMALFCYARTHLREQGRAIAAACDPANLLNAGGAAGVALLQQAGAAGDTWGAVARPERRRVSLAGH